MKGKILGGAIAILLLAGGAHAQTAEFTGLGDLPGGAFHSSAWGVSGDGSVVVGYSESANGTEAFRWTQADGMVGLGDLPGGNFESVAWGVNSDGSVIVGHSESANGTEAFRWTQAGGMVGLGDLPGGAFYSAAYGVNGDGSVIVGESETANGTEAFRWTQAGGMQRVADWLAANGVRVENWTLLRAFGVSDDGSIVVGEGVNASGNTEAWIARASGVIMPSNFNASLANIAAVGPAALNAVDLYLNGLHGRPGWRRRGTSRYCSWAAGDFGRDSHGRRNGNLGLGEMGLCWRPSDGLYFSTSVAYSGFSQKLAWNGKADGNGVLFGLEGQARLGTPLGAPLWLVADAVGGWSKLVIDRGYLNAGQIDKSRGDTSYRSYGGRLRLEWENVVAFGERGGLTPLVDLSVLNARIKGYTEKGGGFPVHFNAMSRTVTELRIGIDADWLASPDVRLYAGAQYVHRYGRQDYAVSGQVIGLYSFSGLGYSQYDRRDWGQFRVGSEITVGPGNLNLAVSATTRGATPSWWLSAGYRVDF